MWLLEVAVYGIGLLLVGYLVWTQLIAPRPPASPEDPGQPRRRIDRRELERGDRRQDDAGPPDGENRRVVPDRRRK